jgi:hypothetical protein
MQSIEEVSQVLSKKLGLQLEVDAHGGFRLLYANELAVNVEIDASGERLLIASELSEVASGGFREECLKAALMANSLPYPRFGNLCFSTQENKLILFEYLPLREISDEDLFGYLHYFVENAQKWKAAVETGELPQIETEAPSSGGSGAYGL